MVDYLINMYSDVFVVTIQFKVLHPLLGPFFKYTNQFVHSFNNYFLFMKQ